MADNDITPPNPVENAVEMPREKFQRLGGPQGLSSEELLAILLKTGARGCGVLQLAHRLIAAFGGVGYLVRSDSATFARQIQRYNETHRAEPIHGIGEVKRIELACVFELVRREYEKRHENICELDLTKVENRYQAFRRVLNPWEQQEHFCVLLVDTKWHPIIEPIVIFKGTLNRTIVHPREVFREAIRWGAYGVMVAHNHPSGDSTPGDIDIHLTRRLCDIGVLMAIPVLDHIVIGMENVVEDSSKGNVHQGYVSMRERKILEFPI